MSAGTLTLTNDTDAVTGSGTAFTTELAAGDFIVVTVGGIPYTLPVKTVNNNTSLTLVSVYTGPTQSGAAWSAVPRVALNMVTAALVAQSAEALRGLNFDKQNWQQVFSGTGTITVKLPDGSTYAGPSWKEITSVISGKAKKGDNDDITSLSGLTTALSVSQGGTGAFSAWEATKNLKTLRTMERRFVPGDEPRDIGWSNTIGFVVGQTSTGANGAFVDFTSFDQQARLQIVGFYSDAQNHNGVGYNLWNPNPQIWYPFTIFRDTRNTTVDSNGFIKIASPIVKIFGNGSFETNDESEGVKVKRTGTGEYLIEGCAGLNADAAWGGIDGGFEIPVDRNKLARIWLDYDVNADGSILVKTYHRTHPDAPVFARNEIDGVTNGDPVDIPADSFVSVRVEMPVDNIWNKKQEATRIAMEEARMKEERTDGNNV
ncbi:phage tail protein [Salmonella enterica subsp. enterica serovar Hermannswerder]|nr:phage tail protein [Salmonella enterica]EBV1498001.1 phage tail protein [Salmonella enterica subsp. enterica serovar Moroto]EBX4346470.1 phage tail protein [Salmonella enterica subsp. enterica serovar Halle]EDW1164631.1 phage tail protein [Salmonella enterica subsp. enterica]EGI6166625.1 phage tail protein [Salmonella enterica subsp. enterica serovar Hermannswerder]